MQRNERLEKLDYAREQAYVTVLEYAANGKLVAGTLGPVPADVIRAAGGWTVPLLSQDDTTLSYCNVPKLCDPAAATIGYAKSGKCPLIYAANPVLIHTGCAHRMQIAECLGDKTILLYEKEDADWEEKLCRVIGFHPSDAALQKEKQQTIRLHTLHRKLRDAVKKKSLSLEDWVTVTDGVRFLPDRKEQEEMLSYFVDEMKAIKGTDLSIPIGISTLYGTDPALQKELDKAPYGYDIRYVGCEAPAEETVDCVPLVMTNCACSQEKGSITLGQTGPVLRAHLINMLHKGEQDDSRQSQNVE